MRPETSKDQERSVEQILPSDRCEPSLGEVHHAPSGRTVPVGPAVGPGVGPWAGRSQSGGGGRAAHRPAGGPKSVAVSADAGAPEPSGVLRALALSASGARLAAPLALVRAPLTPVLVRAVGALLPVAARGPLAGLTHLALDTVRCGRWELFVLGMVWHGRVVPLAWAVLPYPLPKGQFTPTVCALLCQVAAVWPAERPVHLVADRAFASGRLLRLLRALKWGYTLRLRARLHLTVGGREQAVPELWTAAPAAQWSAQPAQ